MRLRRDLWRDCGVWLIGLVQQTSGSWASGASGTETLTLSSTPTNGNSLFALGISGDSINTIAGGGVTWTQITVSSTHVATEIWGGGPVTAGGTALTLTYFATPLTASASAIAAEFSGVATPLATDGTGAANGVASPAATASIATTNANDLLLAVAGLISGAVGAPGAGWTAFTSPTQQANLIEAAYQIVSATGSYSNTWGDTGAGWDAVIAALKGLPTPVFVAESPLHPLVRF